MAFTVALTPGTQVTSTTDITPSVLNLLAQPTVQVTGATTALSNWSSTAPTVTGQAAVWNNTSGYWEPGTVGRAYVQAFTGATTTVDGTTGGVPAPTSAQRTYFLQGNGTWAVPATGAGIDLFLFQTVS
jgi:hypothetical protein